jgi:hypothetical protein
VAGRVLVQIGGKEIMLSFIHALKDPKESVRMYTVEALGTIGTPDAIEQRMLVGPYLGMRAAPDYREYVYLANFGNPQKKFPGLRELKM